MKIELHIRTHKNDPLVEPGCTCREIILIPEDAKDKRFFKDWCEDNYHTEIYQGKDKNMHILI